jgi:hypothetical protein
MQLTMHTVEAFEGLQKCKMWPLANHTSKCSGTNHCNATFFAMHASAALIGACGPLQYTRAAILAPMIAIKHKMQCMQLQPSQASEHFFPDSHVLHKQAIPHHFLSGYNTNVTGPNS